MKISTVQEMRDLDRTAIEQYGIPEELLMENAGHAAYFTLLTRFGLQGRMNVIFCGGGNNGGDGFVVARKILSSGGRAKVFVLGDRGKYRGAARMNLEILDHMAADVVSLDSGEAAEHDLAHCDGVIDAIFGTGLDREVGGRYADVIHRINQSGKPVLSLDIPSGVQGDTGRVMGVAVRANATVTFGLPKLGNLLYPGADLCGELFVTHISFPPAMIAEKGLKVEINVTDPLPDRDPKGHKGTFGDVLFVAGASTYFGAPLFSALSFLRSGGGYARLAAPASMIPHIASQGSEIVFVPQEETTEGSIAGKNRDALLARGAEADMVVLGPGLSLVEETQALARDLAANLDCPLLLDGDGITALCRDLDLLRNRKAETVLTPHPGEMSRITDLSVAEIAQDPIGVLQRTAADLGAVIVLKGAHSLVGQPDGQTAINTSGNSGMATAGSGDVLTGTIAAMKGLGMDIPSAVRKGVFLHGLAGDLAADDLGPDGITAQDILDALPLALKADREGLDDDLRRRYRGAQLI
ncbi:MAG: NAD(P)H-hydrate dehydratase [Desulfobacteraceae bacterium]|jgi:NAD(P)H-hydrate epimerase